MVEKNVSTQNETSNYEIIGTRIVDYLFSSIIRNMISNVETLPCACSNHFIMLNLKNQKKISLVVYLMVNHIGNEMTIF